MASPLLVAIMRTNIEIDERLMRQAMRVCAGRTKRAVIEEALCLLIRVKDQTAIRRLRGKIRWEGDLAAQRVRRAPRRSSSPRC